MLKNNILQSLKLYLSKWEFMKHFVLVELIKEKPAYPSLE